ncbi:hypothetical protein [Streptomyces sp. URMC 123]|uniref:hypothetical protein n=1 Tax=Streptomyces sp. URMC 123 TaxID=3423403 RepID=UPI003F1C2731
MTYRTGAIVVDTRTGAVGRVVAEHGDQALLRPTAGRPPWWCPVTALRLARGQERTAVRVRPEDRV